MSHSCLVAYLPICALQIDSDFVPSDCVIDSLIEFSCRRFAAKTTTTTAQLAQSIQSESMCQNVRVCSQNQNQTGVLLVSSNVQLAYLRELLMQNNLQFKKKSLSCRLI